jgi:hypothetical protein
VYDFNMLVSFRRWEYRPAIREIQGVLRKMGDESPIVKSTLARGIIGVKTALNSREVCF